MRPRLMMLLGLLLVWVVGFGIARTVLIMRSTPPGPRLVCPAAIEWPEAELLDTLVREMEFTNAWVEPLVLSRIRSTCG